MSDDSRKKKKNSANLDSLRLPTKVSVHENARTRISESFLISFSNAKQTSFQKIFSSSMSEVKKSISRVQIISREKINLISN